MNTPDRPASGKLVLRHPDKVKIEAPFESISPGQGSVVRFKQLSPTTTMILFIDPDRRTSRLRVPFSLTDPNAAPFPLSQFTIAPDSERLYRLDGTLLPPTTDPNAVGNSFMVDQKFF
jgi:hypothetical protein